MLKDQDPPKYPRARERDELQARKNGRWDAQGEPQARRSVPLPFRAGMGVSYEALRSRVFGCGTFLTRWLFLMP